jgi:hypothetical protein
MGKVAERLKTEFGLETNAERADRSSSMINLSQDSCCNLDQAEDSTRIAELAATIKKEKANVASAMTAEESLRKQQIDLKYELDAATIRLSALAQLAKFTEQFEADRSEAD